MSVNVSVAAGGPVGNHAARVHSRVIQFSGGTGSWAAARRVVDAHGIDGVTLLFADTLAEDQDLYRFIDDAARDIGVPVTRVCDGRTPEEVDVSKRWLSNNRVAQCSKLLKIAPCRQWIEQHCDPATTTLYVGIDWSESARVPGIVRGWAPWTVETPLTEPPYLDKQQIDGDLRARGIIPPRLTVMGFPHNNCGGACIRGGQAHFAMLLDAFPDRYAAKEAHERRMRDMLDADVSILRDRRNGASKSLTLTALRERIEGKAAIDADDWGGCGCTTDIDSLAV